MKIKRMELNNFKSIAHKELIPGKYTISLGKNGTGKTSLIEALRFAMTGEAPDGELIKDGQRDAITKITLENESGEAHTFARMVSRAKNQNAVFMDGAKTTQKALNTAIESLVGIPVENIKVTSSSELVAAMKPQEFASFILGYTKSTVTLKDVLAAVPDTDPSLREQVESFIKELVPETGVTIETINNANDTFRAFRKDYKDSFKRQEAQMLELPHEDPGFDVKALKDKLRLADDLKKAQDEYNAKKRAYDSSLAALKKWEKDKAQLQADLAKLPDKRPNPIALNTVNEKLSKLRDSVLNQQKTIAGVEAALRQLNVTRDALSKPICPISPLITCHENKTVAIKDIEDSITATEEGLAAIQTELDKSVNEIKESEKQKGELEQEKLLYEKRCALAKALKTLSDNPPTVPAEPTLPPAGDESELLNIKQKISLMEKWEEYKDLVVKHAALQLKVDVCEILCKAFAENGEVRTAIIKKYLGAFETVMNDRAVKFMPGARVQFEAADGVVIKFAKDGVNFHVYEDLSGGEKAFLLFAILDLLNQLTGCKLLILDEINVMDTDILDSLISFVQANESEYDHIFLSGVDFPSITDLFKKHGLIA